MAPLPEWIICLRLIYVIIIFTLGVSGNGTIVLVQLKNRKKSSTDCLILAMAIFDFVLAGVVAPMAAIQSFTEVWSQLSTDWACKFYQYAVFTSTFASTQLLAAVAFDRYRNTCKPHAKLFTPRAALRLASFVTLISMAICSVVFVFAGVKKDGTCGMYEDRRFEGTMFRVSLATLFFIMMVIVTVCYSMVASTLHKRFRQKIQTKQSGLGGVSTRTNKVSVFRKKNKVEAVELSPFTHNDNLRDGKMSDEKQGEEPKPGPSCMTDVRETTIQESIENESEVARRSAKQFLGWDLINRLTTSFSAKNETKSMNKQQEQAESSSMSSIYISVRPPSAPFFSWQLSDRATCGPTICAPVQGRTEETSCGIKSIDDGKQETARKLTREEHKINKTTKMMFLITVIYTVSWILVWTTGAYASIGENSSTELGLVLTKLLSLTYMINSVSNPILYILMSSLFRKRVRALFSNKTQPTTS